MTALKIVVLAIVTFVINVMLLRIFWNHGPADAFNLPQIGFLHAVCISFLLMMLRGKPLVKLG